MAENVGNMILKLSVNSTEWTVGLDKASQSLDKANRAVKQHAEHVERSFKATSKSLLLVTEHFGQMGRILPGSLSRVGEAVATVTRQTASMGAGFARFAGIAGGVVAAVGAAGAALAEMSTKGAEYVERLSLMSQRTGITISNLQAFSIMAQTSGASLEDIVTATRKFDQALTQIGRHTGIATSVLRTLHVTSTDNKEAMLQVADAFAKMDDGAVKNAYAMALFGKSYAQIIPLLNRGRQGFEEADLAAAKYGATISKEMVQKTEEWKQSTVNLGTAWEGAAAKISSVFLPAITAVKQTMADVVSGELYHLIKGDAGERAGVKMADKDREEKAAKAQQAAVDVVREHYKLLFEERKAGSAAVAALQRKEQEITDAVTAQNFKQADALQKEIPALQKAVDLDKERLAIKQAQAAFDKQRTEDIRKINATIKNGYEGWVALNERGAAQLAGRTVGAMPGMPADTTAETVKAANEQLRKQQEAVRDERRREIAPFSLSVQTEEVSKKFADIRAKMKAELGPNADMLGVNAAELASQRALTHEWDAWSLEAGNAGQKAKAMFQELSLEGENFAKTFWAASHAAIEGLEKHLATFIVTGRRRDAVKIGVAFEETILTGVLHSVVGKAAGGLVKLIPSLGKIPGVGDLAKGTLGTRGNPMIVQSVDAAAAAAKSTVPDLAGIPLPGPARVGVGLPDLGGVTKAIGAAGGPGSKGGIGDLFGSLGSIFKSLFGTGKAGGAPAAGAVSDAKGSAFKANLGKLAKFDEGFQPSQKKSGGLFGMLGSLASIGAMFIPGGQALSAGMMALKAGLAAAPMIGGGLDALTGLASGGDVTPGQAYVVGEKRPELFVPNAAGRIYPSVNMDRKGGSGETTFNFQPVVHATDSEGVDRMLVEHGRVFAKHFQQWARRENA